MYYIILQHKHAHEVSELSAIHPCFDPAVNICVAKYHKQDVTTLNSNREERRLAGGDNGKRVEGRVRAIEEEGVEWE